MTCGSPSTEEWIKKMWNRGTRPSHAAPCEQVKLDQAQRKERGDLRGGGGVRRGDHLTPHKYIKNTST